MKEYNRGDKFVIEIDGIYQDNDNNLLYSIKGVDNMFLSAQVLSNLTEASANTKRIYAQGWNDGVNQAFQTINKGLAKLSLDNSKKDELK